MSEEGNFSIEDNFKMFDIITYSQLQLLVYHPFNSIEANKEKVENHVDSQCNEETIFPTVISHEKGIKTEFDGVDKYQ